MFSKTTANFKFLHPECTNYTQFSIRKDGDVENWSILTTPNFEDGQKIKHTHIIENI